MRQGNTVTDSGAKSIDLTHQGTPRPNLISLIKPSAADAAGVHELVSICKPLDLNSTYAYLLLCHHFAETCVIAKIKDGIVGFISGYTLPEDPTTFFVWQVAVHPGARGAHLGVRMLHHLLKRKSNAQAQFVETTVSPSNEASRRMFRHFAESISAPIDEQMLFDRAAFGNEDHEEEVLMKIGPINPAQSEKEML